MMSKRKMRRMRGKRRYSLAELLKGTEAVKQLNADLAWARDGEPFGREILSDFDKIG